MADEPQAANSSPPNVPPTQAQTPTAPALVSAPPDATPNPVTSVAEITSSTANVASQATPPTVEPATNATSTANASQQTTPAPLVAPAVVPTPTVAPVPQPANTGNVIKPRNEKGKEALTCGTVFLAFIAVIFLFISVSNSRTGLLNVPWLVADYVPEKPVRYVAYAPLDWNGFTRYVGRTINTENTEHGPPFEVTVTEKQMTGLLADSMSEGLRDVATEIQRAQIVVLPERLEMTVQLLWANVINLDFNFWLVPNFDERGDLRFDVSQAKLGHVILPSKWLWPILAQVFTRDLGTWRLKAGDWGILSIQDVKLNDGTIVFVFSPKN